MSSCGDSADALPPDAEASAEPPGQQGALLRRERERRGLSLIDASRRVTLSCEQIEQIENGGTAAFYSADHQWLATRKYASVLGIALPDLPAQSGEPPSDAERDKNAVLVRRGRAVGEGPARASRRLRRGITMTALTLGLAAIVLAVPYTMLQQLAAVLRIPAGTTAAAGGEFAAAPATKRIPDRAEAPRNVLAATTPLEDCGLDGADERIERWAPEQASRHDTRLFLTSAAETDVCVIDAVQTLTHLHLRPGITAIVEGKPPYLLRSTQLHRLRIFFQGLKVRVKAAAGAVRLFRARNVQHPPLPATPADAAS